MTIQPTDPTPAAVLRRSEECERLEEAGFIGASGREIYYVLHPTERQPEAAVILAGPFASERPRRYHAWANWARWLALSGFAALRFDFRGVGESLGRFEDMDFDSWSADVECCAEWLSHRFPGVPLVIHGIGLGALVGTRAFRHGTGDALLRWLKPANGQEMLYEQLRLRISSDFSLESGTRKTRDDYVEEIMAGVPVEVEGYYWTRHLWESALTYSEQLDSIQGSLSRPVCDAELDKLASHSFSGTGPNPLRVRSSGIPMRLLNPDLRNTFIQNTEWLNNAVQEIRRSSV
jgi:alpha/beta superfamily hydrolase